ncbi:hypothetical protein OG763_09950 [Streptomyces sp. NBC_01230]|uniref:hypothetical protein n=1 Tax=Streptomyces sp. NBC_01230 TaxID=2903784 RepID=UPI002E0D9389|nr:hypothetical protein OG763_09950 [Streptomyces sp. NBC_01230]
MDEGLAVAIGGVIGGATAIAAAWLNRSGMLRQAERQTGAQREQWKLTMRREALVAFLIAGDDFCHAGDAYWEHIERGRVSPELLHDVRRTFGETYRVLHRASTTLYLESPRDLAGKVRDLRNKAWLAYRQLTDETIAEIEGMGERDVYRHRQQYAALVTRVAVELQELADEARPQLMALEDEDWNWDREAA